MTLRLIKVITIQKIPDELLKKINDFETVDSWQIKDVENNKTFLSILTSSELTQKVIDLLKIHLGQDERTRVVILSPEAAIPAITSDQNTKKIVQTKEKKQFLRGVSREEIYHTVASDAELTWNYVLLIILSTLVATIGMVENNLAVLIGAMLIAPMLAPNLAFSFGVVMGDFKLMLNAIKTNLVGIGFSILTAFVSECVLNYFFDGSTFYLNVHVGYDSIVLALVSGAAAVISLISGLSGALVGVMVAVALLPPAAMIGIFLSQLNYTAALGSALLLIINIVCVNLSANILFLLKGFSPAWWYEKQRAKKIVFWVINFWIIVLIILGFLVWSYFTVT